MERLAVRLDGFDPGTARRMATTVSCSDSDQIAKVDGAGEIRQQGEVSVQVMHNGVLIERDCYYGEWMTEIIRVLRGHHEPQEELVFDQIVKRLSQETDSAVMIEVGSFWTYYGLWFCQALPLAKVVALEPDPSNLEVGRRNATLNGFDDRVTFVHAAIGPSPGRLLRILADSDGQSYDVIQHDLASLMKTSGLERVDLVLCDAQGAESVLLERARTDLKRGVVRFLVVSTHHHSISGSAVTHQQALSMLVEAGAHVIAEHSVSESFSGDGLIAVSFDDRDKHLVVPISYARSKDSLFGELEVDLASQMTMNAQIEQARAQAQRQVEHLNADLNRLTSERNALLDEMYNADT